MKDEIVPSSEVLLKDLDGPAFDKPWQSEAFALVVSMNRAGLFRWKDWAETFTSEIEAEPALPGESVNDAYYRQWVSALEKLVASLGLVTCGDVTSRAQEWRHAHLNTPHGHPILLENAMCPPAVEHKHKHEPQRLPIKVVAAMA